MTPARAHIFHAPWLLAILWSFTRATPWLPVMRSKRSDLGLMLKVISRGWVCIARDARGPAGFIARDGARIHALYVHPRARRQGLARALLDDAKTRSPRLELWVLEANSPARAFYARQGFDVAGRSDGAGNDENMPDIHMVWQSRERTDP